MSQGTPTQPKDSDTSSVRAHGLNREQIGLLQQALEPLAKIGKTLPGRALEFVLEGAQEDVLLELCNAQSLNPGELLGNPGRLRWSFYHYQDKALQRLGEKSLAERAQLYATLSAATPPLGALVRLGQLLAAADHGKSLEHPGAPVPDWFQYLVNDALFASFNNDGGRDLQQTRPAWTAPLLAKLLAHEGLEESLALQEVFERKGLDSRYHDHLAGLVDAAELADYLRAHAEAANALPAQLSVAGRLLLAQRIGRDKTLLNDFAPLFVRLAIDSGKTVRAAAALHLDGIETKQRLALLDRLLREGDTAQRTQAAELLARIPGEEARTRLASAVEQESSKAVQRAIRAALAQIDTAEDMSVREPPTAQKFLVQQPDISRRALETLGDGISPAALLTEARKGLTAKLPAGLNWFPFDALPACRWTNGESVAAEILKWWVVLACKLKEPGGNVLLTRYLGLLDGASREALGAFVLRQFIAQDTRRPPLEEVIAHAQANAPQRYRQYQQSYMQAKPQYRRWFAANYNKTAEQVFEECKREKMNEYLGSAIGEKGILALSVAAPAHEVITLLQQYMREHSQRRAQIEAMLESAAPGNDPIVIEFLLGLARHHRSTFVQEKARALVRKIAARNGWTQEQLADRTIPTAGFDDSGKLELPYGERVFTLTLNATLEPELRNPNGKLVKALPEPRQNDDPALVKETRAQLAASKKELRQIIAQQTARLAEAMYAGRVWPQNEWREDLQRHPIVSRLIQRLVWLEADARGAIRSSFRPAGDGRLIDTRNNEVALQTDSLLRLGHASLINAQTAAAWAAHFKDHKLTPLFPQIANS
ncbi:MAG: DUF4132 domain-containing protein [Betaproteobacteria bacterium]|nr:DUF4132 domain-containing protein [Betaproteobacteria bacterium]